MDFTAVSFEIMGVLINSAPFLTKLHNASDILGGSENRSPDVRFFGGINGCRVGIVRGVVEFKNASVVEMKFINNAGRGGDEVKVIFSFKTLEDNFHMKKSEESAAETETESGGSFRLKMEGSVVESELFKSIAEVAVFCAVERIDTRINHRVDLFVTRKSFFRRVFRKGNGVADGGIRNGFDGSGNVTDFTGFENSAWNKPCCAHITNFNNVEFRAGCHHLDSVAGMEFAVNNADINDYSAVAVINGVEDKRFERRFVVSFRSGNSRDDRFKNGMYVNAGFCGNLRCIKSGNSDDILDFVGNSVRICRGKVDFVDYRDDFKVVVNRKICVRKSLCLNALGSVNNENRAFAGGKRTGNLIVEVNVSGGIDKVEDIVVSVVGFIIKTDCAGFDCDSAFTFNIHIIQKLFFHFTGSDGLGVFKDSVGKGGFAVVDMCDYTKVSYVVIRHCLKSTSCANYTSLYFTTL